MAVDEKILTTVHKLLNMTTDRGCTEGEAQSAAARVQELLLRHNLDLAQVKLIGSDTTPVGTTHLNVKMKEGSRVQSVGWCLQLAQAVAWACTCQYLWSKAARLITFVGAHDSVTVARELYAFLVDQVELLSIRAAWNLPVLALGAPGTRTGKIAGRPIAVPKGFRRADYRVTADTFAFRQSFLLGCSVRVAQRLEEQARITRESMNAHGEVTALVKVQDAQTQNYIDRVFTVVKAATVHRPTVRSRYGWLEGFDAGETVQLNRQRELEGS